MATRSFVAMVVVAALALIKGSCPGFAGVAQTKGSNEEAIVLLRRLAAATSADSVLNGLSGLHQASWFSSKHLATAFLRLGRLAETFDAESPGWRPLKKLLCQAAGSDYRLLDADATAAVLGAMVPLSDEDPQLLELLPLLLSHLKGLELRGKLSAAALARALGALEVLRDVAEVDASLAFLAQLAAGKLTQMSPRALTECCSALASCSDHQLHQHLVTILQRMIVEPWRDGAILALPQLLCTLVKSSLAPPELLREVAERSLHSLDGFSDRGLCALAWSFRADRENFEDFRVKVAAEMDRRGIADLVPHAPLGPRDLRGPQVYAGLSSRQT